MSQGRSWSKESWVGWAVAVVVIALAGTVLVVKVWRQNIRPAEAQELVLSTVAVRGTPASDLPLSTGSALSPQEELHRLLDEGKPVLAFFHSMTCTPCIQMDKIVKKVYPDFHGKVGLVDVNVYDKANQDLLRWANVRVIPTLIFIDSSGGVKGYTGVMPAADLRAQLQTLAEGGG